MFLDGIPSNQRSTMSHNTQELCSQNHEGITKLNARVAEGKQEQAGKLPPR
jgi:hypothetical protein